VVCDLSPLREVYTPRERLGFLIQGGVVSWGESCLSYPFRDCSGRVCMSVILRVQEFSGICLGDLVSCVWRVLRLLLCLHGFMFGCSASLTMESEVPER